MSNLTVAELEAALLKAKKAERKVSKPLRYTQIIPDYDPAGESLAAALAHKVTLVEAVKGVDAQLIKLANNGNVKYKALVDSINAWNKLVPDASENEYKDLLAKIAAAESDAGMLKLNDYTQNYVYTDLKKYRNVAVSELSAHIQIIEALEAVI